MQKFISLYRDFWTRHKKFLSRFVFWLGSCLLLASCQNFEKRRLDLGAHDDEWKSRGASSEKVQAFAKRLSKGSSGVSKYDLSDGVSLNEGKVIALVFNPDLRVARLKAGVTKATADHAGLWEDPTLSANILRVTESIPDPWILGSSLSFTIPVSGRLQAEKKRAAAAMSAEIDRVTEAEWKVTMDVQKAWISWSTARTELSQTREIVDALGGIVKSTQALAKQGELPKTEAALFAIEQESRRAELARLESEVAAGEQKIRALLGISPSAPIVLTPVLNAPSRSTSKKRLAQNNPTLNRLRGEYQVAELSLLKEIRKQYPDLTIGPQGEKDRDESGFGLVASIPLPILNANKGGIAVARAKREVAQAAFETEYERKVGQLASLQSQLGGIRSQRSSIEKNLIPMVDRQVADAEKLVQLGEGGSLVLLESLVRAHEAKLKMIAIQNQYSQVKTDLQFLLGPKTHNSK